MCEYSAESTKKTIAVPDTFFEACAKQHVLKRTRLYLIAKCADATGQGWIVQSDLHRFLRRYKSASVVSRWIASLTMDDLFVTAAHLAIEGKRTPVWFIRSPHAVLDRLGAPISRRYIHVKLDGLLSQHWRHEVHLSVLSSREDRPTARVTSRIRSGVGEFTQRTAERAANVKVHFNCHLFDANDPSAPRPDNRGVIQRKDGTIQVQLPNSYDFSANPRRVTRRRRKTGRSQLMRPNVHRRHYVMRRADLRRETSSEVLSPPLVLLGAHDGWRTWKPLPQLSDLIFRNDLAA